MTKRICDLCGKETNLLFHFVPTEETLKSLQYLQTDRKAFGFMNNEACPSCIQKMAHLISRLDSLQDKG